VLIPLLPLTSKDIYGTVGKPIENQGGDSQIRTKRSSRPTALYAATASRTMPSQLVNAKGRDAAAATTMDIYLIAEEDVPYEEELVRNPYSLKPWLHYLQHKTDRPLHEKVFVLERACRELPGSYKLWKMYLDLRVRHLERVNPAIFEEEYDKVNDAFERALVLLNKVPHYRSLMVDGKLTLVLDAADMDHVSQSPDATM